MILKLRLAPPSERYQRFADRGDALGFAAKLAESCPNVGTAVFYGAGLDHRVRCRSMDRATGFVVALADDPQAAIAAGAGGLIAKLRPNCA
jgi:hypothetical protein